MARFCPITNRKVVYLECNECEEKICRQHRDLNHAVVTGDTHGAKSDGKPVQGESVRRKEI